MRNEIHITIFKPQLYQYWMNSRLEDNSYHEKNIFYLNETNCKLRRTREKSSNLEDDIFIKNNLTPLTTSTTDWTENTHFFYLKKYPKQMVNLIYWVNEYLW